MRLLCAILMLLVSAAPAFSEDYSFPVEHTGRKPGIADFVNAILAQEDCGEKLGEMAEDWQAYRSGQPLPRGRFIYVDGKHGFMRYDAESPAEDDYPFSFRTAIEYKVMRCSGDRQTLVVENTVQYRDGQPFCGQFSGLTFYLYDSRTGRMEQAYACDLVPEDYEPPGTLVTVHALRPGRCVILCKCHTESGFIYLSLIWNGKRFHIR